jgi:hypothetical protein
VTDRLLDPLSPHPVPIEEEGTGKPFLLSSAKKKFEKNLDKPKIKT